MSALARLRSRRVVPQRSPGEIDAMAAAGAVVAAALQAVHAAATSGTSTASPPALSQHRPDLADLDAVLAKALSKDPSDRYTRCADFARALVDGADALPKSPPSAPTADAKVSGKTSAKPSAPTPAFPPSKQEARWRQRGPILTAAGVIVVIVAAATIWRVLHHSSVRGAAATNGSAISSPPVSGAPQTPPGSTASPESPVGIAPTEVHTTVAVVNGQPANGFHEALNASGLPIAGCDTASPAAVTPNVYGCYPYADGADVCWAAPPASLLCLDDPWVKGLRRFAFDAGLLADPFGRTCAAELFRVNTSR